MNTVAEEYVKLVLAVGRHDADYVDAYHGPAEWQAEVQTLNHSLSDIKQRAHAALEKLHTRKPADEDYETVRLRYVYLKRQLEALIARVEMLEGKRFSFDDESKALYDAVAPKYTADHFADLVQQLDEKLPGKGRVQERYLPFKDQFIIPQANLDAVFSAAIDECRSRTAKHIALPPGESFTVEYVTNKSWSGYNWFKGGSMSLIQMNTDLPIYIDRAVDLAAHEGYPGHHVYNSLLEWEFLKKRGWVEFSVYALFSPQSLIAEGTANFGIEVCFSQDERIAFERDVLFPRAGMDPSVVSLYYEIHGLFLQLSYAGNEAARGYLDGALSRERAVQWLVDYALMSHDRASQRVRFFDQYRSYVINYNLGQDIVKSYIERLGGTTNDPAKRWTEFTRLISSPRLPSSLL